jgi:hypothetical protein
MIVNEQNPDSSVAGFRGVASAAIGFGRDTSATVRFG